MTLKVERIQFYASNVEGSIKEADNCSQIISNINIYKNLEAGRLQHSIYDTIKICQRKENLWRSFKGH